MRKREIRKQITQLAATGKGTGDQYTDLLRKYTGFSKTPFTKSPMRMQVSKRRARNKAARAMRRMQRKVGA